MEAETTPAEISAATITANEPVQVADESTTVAQDEAEASEKPQPRRSSRISSATKPTAEEVKTPRRGAAAKKRTADEADEAEKEEENGTGSKKARGAKSKKANESDEGLTLGEPIPDLVVKSENDEDVNVKNLAEGHAGVVIFLVPKADTPGCTTQACGFRDIYPDFQGLNFKVYCLSADSPAAQSKWQTKKSLPYPLLSDPERKLIATLTGSSSKTPRSHFVFADGKLVDKKMPVKPADSPRLALEFIKTLGKTGDAPMETDTPAKPAEEATKPEPPAVESSADPTATDNKEG